MSVVYAGFITLDGIVADPAGTDGTPHGGWLFRYGREAIEGDKFKVGKILQEGVAVYGRGTWEAFAQLWPNRDTPFSGLMNGAAKLVATRTLKDVSAWANSIVLPGDVVAAVKCELRDVVVMGSTAVVHQLAAADLIDEYRLITVPTVLGAGDRLFPDGAAHTELDVVDTEASGPFVLTVYHRSGR